MSQIQTINNNSEVANREQALAINMSASKSIQSLMRSNLGPKGTLKVLVGGAGDLRLTKDGNVLLHDMQIQHPTALMIARTATAQDDMTGDGTTSIVLFVGELLEHAAKYISEGTHPSVLIEGIYLAKTEAQKFLKKIGEQHKEKISVGKETLTQLAKTSLRTKLREEMADKLASIVVDSVEKIKRENEKKQTIIDLHMVELMHMKNKMDTSTIFVDGIVMDHGARHPEMSKDMKKCAILTCNVTLEYEKSEVHSGFYVTSSQKRQQFVEAERKVVDDKVRKIIELKKKVCDPNNPDAPKNFVVINEKGIDPLSLDLFCKAGITALRRAKRRNMERLTLACGGVAVNSVEDLTPEVLGFAEHVHETTLGEDKYTFVEGTQKGKSCTILIRGPNLHTIAQIKDAVRDGLRTVKNVYDDQKIILPGAGAVEIALSEHLFNYAKEVKGRKQLGVKCFAEALLVVPKVLASNSGLDQQDSIIKLTQEFNDLNTFEKKDDDNVYTLVGLDLETGEPIDPIQEGIFDNYKVKQQILEASTFTATQLLYVDEILKAGKTRRQPVEEN